MVYSCLVATGDSKKVTGKQLEPDCVTCSAQLSQMRASESMGWHAALLLLQEVPGRWLRANTVSVSTALSMVFSWHSRVVSYFCHSAIMVLEC